MAATYAPKLVVIIVGGVLISGFAEDKKVEVERNQDTFKLAIGVDGEGTRAKVNDRSGKITIFLQNSSGSNSYLSSIAQADEIANAGVVDILIQDLGGGSLYHADTAWVLKPPAASHEKKVTDRKWVFETDSLDWLENGN